MIARPLFLISLFTLVCGLLFKGEKRGASVLCCIGALACFSLVLLVDVSTFSDGITYARRYSELNQVPNEAFATLIQKYFVEFDGDDYGYTLLCSIFKFWLGVSSYRVFHGLLFAVFSVLLARFIYKSSDNPCLSFLLFIAVFEWFYFAAVRQMIATAIAVLVGWTYVEKRNLIGFSLLCLLASFFHFSALVFLPVYFLSAYDYLDNIVFKIALIVIVEIISFVPLSAFLREEFFYGENYVGGSTYIYAGVLAIMLVASLAYRNKFSPVNEQFAKAGFWSVVVSFAIVPFAFVNSNAFRVAYYYMIFLLPMIPTLISVFANNEQFVIKSTCYTVLLLYGMLLSPVMSMSLL